MIAVISNAGRSFFAITMLLLLAFAGSTRASLADTAYIDSGLVRIRTLKYEDPQHAMRLSDTILGMAKALGSTRRVVFCHIAQGTIHDDLGEYDKAFACYDSALILCQQLGFKKGIANVYNNKAIIYTKMGRLEAALSNHLHALRSRQSFKDSAGIASSLGNIGLVYTSMKQYKKAIENIEECIRIKKQMHDAERNIGRWYNSLAIAYDDDGQDSIALGYYFKAMTISEAAGDEYSLGFLYGNIGTYYQEQQLYARALTYMMKAYHILKKSDAPDALTINAAAVAGLLNELGRYKEALPYGQESLRIADSLNSYEFKSRAHNVLGASYAMIGNGALANEHYRQSWFLKDSIYNKNTAEATAALDAKYRSEIKEEQIKTLKQQNEIKQLTINAGKTSLATTRYIAALLILIIAVIVIVFYTTIQRLKIKQQLRLAREKEQQQKEGIAAVIQAQEDERERIARELHDNVCQQLGAVRIRLQHNTSEIAPAVAMLDNVTTEIRSISYQMLPVTLQHYGLVPAIEELARFSFTDAIAEVVFEDLGVDAPVREQVKLATYRVAQELLSNVLKHSGAQKVNIQLYTSRGNLVLVVEDNGKGMSDIKSGKGMGLLNIRTRIQQVEGELMMENGTGTGLRTIVKIPLAA